MRIGNQLSTLLDPSQPALFHEHPVDLLPEEVWHYTAGDSKRQLSLPHARGAGQATCAAGGATGSTSPSSGNGHAVNGSVPHQPTGSSAQDWGSDHESDSDDDSLQAYDLTEADEDGKTDMAFEYCSIRAFVLQLLYPQTWQHLRQGYKSFWSRSYKSP